MAEKTPNESFPADARQGRGPLKTGVGSVHMIDPNDLESRIAEIQRLRVTRDGDCVGGDGSRSCGVCIGAPVRLVAAERVSFAH